MRWFEAIALVGCSFTPRAAQDAGRTADAAIEALPDACTTFSSQLDTCALPPPGGDVTWTGTLTYDTTTGTLDDGTAMTMPQSVATTGLRVVLARRFTLDASASVRVTGNLGFAIVAFGDVAIDGTIDATAGGAGAPITCGASDGAAGTNNTGGGAGGGGGGLGAAGGDGGLGDSDGAKVAGGQGGAQASASGLLGGCPGGKGGDGGEPGAPAGLGGGIVYVASVGTITLDGAVNAGGGGGKGGTKTTSLFGDAGGGGGGAGGTIGLDAAHVHVTGTVAANGGGGGEASGSGDPGRDGTTGLATVTAAPGGAGGSPSGSDGGSGGCRDMPAGATVTTNNNQGGGGGGGGAVGFVIVTSADSMLGANVSPAP